MKVKYVQEHISSCSGTVGTYVDTILRAPPSASSLRAHAGIGGSGRWLGWGRFGKRGKLQIVYGLLCAPDGCPVAIEVFEGSTGDPARWRLRSTRSSSGSSSATWCSSA